MYISREFSRIREEQKQSFVEKCNSAVAEVERRALSFKYSIGHEIENRLPTGRDAVRRSDVALSHPEPLAF